MTMKIYELASPVNGAGGFAILRPSNQQDVRTSDVLDVWWDDWGSGGKQIGDFVFCYFTKVCRQRTFDTLQKRFKGLQGLPVRINKTEKERTAKNPKRLRWLPMEEVELTAFFSPHTVECLPESSLVTNDHGIIRIEGIVELRGDLLTPREAGKGLFFSKEAIGELDFFTLASTNFFLCTEAVKEFCEQAGFSNVQFLEVGEVVS